MPLFLFIFIFYNIHTFIQSQYIHPSPFAEASLHVFIAFSAQWGKPPCGAEPRIELGPALQQADALPTEPRHTIKTGSNSASNSASLDTYIEII
jgi:hypothetical protein